MEKGNNNPYCDIDRKIMEGYSELEAEIAVAKKRKEYISKYGYLIDCVMSDSDEIFMLDCHTHGLVDSREHLELQVLMPDCGGVRETQKVGMEIIHRCVDKIDTGEKFKENTIYTDILDDDYYLKFLKFNIRKESILRLLLPDENNMLPDEEKCNPLYKYQLNKYGKLK
ncbi:hypothetical protein ACFHWD_04275 [Clostridium sp. MT-14]|uniref:hypothetical protein n=1 Tax=Clostridium sp. MT-14 TaxID=3348360 RepID=UPI0035F26321